ncbi:MAG: tetratricopeptide repeat protein [Bacteroidia bacterium]
MQIRPLIISVLIALSLTGFSQSKLDSLYTVWEDETKSDSIRAFAYNKYIRDGFLFSKPDSAFNLAEALLSYGINNNYPNAKALAYNIRGIVGYIQSDDVKALENYRRSLAIKEELGDQSGVAAGLNNIGIVYFKQGDNFKALEYYERSLAIREELGELAGVAQSLDNIGIIYNMQDDLVKALEYYRRALAIRESLRDEEGDPKGMAINLDNIGIIYSNHGNYTKALEYFEKSFAIRKELGDQIAIGASLFNIGINLVQQGDNVKALNYHRQCLTIREELGDQKGIAASLNKIGEIYQVQGDNFKALEYYAQSLAIREELKDQRGITTCLKNIGAINQTQGDNIKALNYCNRSNELAQSIESLSHQLSACSCLYKTYKAMSNSKKALEYLEKINMLNDSLDSEETGEKLQQMEFAQALYADSVERAEEARLIKEAHETELAQKNKTRNMLISGGLLALLLAGGFYSRSRHIKKSRDIIAKEKDRSENLLLNILPAEIAAELKEHGEAAAKDFDQVSILFTDFKQFTQLSEKLSAKELVAELNLCFKAFDGICEKHGIEKIKTLGDSYMAAGGLPVPKEDSAHRLTLAALDMTEFVLNRQKERESQGQIPFEMRTGIHTGNVVAGIVGIKKFQYDIWGDTVNTASRMESHGEVGKVNISDATYQLIKDIPEFTFESRGRVEAKGKGQVKMYFVSLV